MAVRLGPGEALASDERRERMPDGAVLLPCAGCDRHARARATRATFGEAIDNARGLSEELLVEGARRSTLDELTDWTLWADKTLTF